MIVLSSVSFFESLRSSTNLRSRIVTLHVRVSQHSVIRDHQEKITGKSHGLSSPGVFIIDVSWLVYNKNVGESGHSISSYSDSSRYSTSMLTEGARVDSSSTRQLWAPSVNISVEYPELPDHDSMNNPSVFSNLKISNKNTKVRKKCYSIKARLLFIYWEYNCRKGIWSFNQITIGF